MAKYSQKDRARLEARKLLQMNKFCRQGGNAAGEAESKKVVLFVGCMASNPVFRSQFMINL